MNNNTQFKNTYRGKNVLVTGHTGFKGSWLCAWLIKLGANVTGFSSYLPSNPCNFEVLNLKNKLTHYQGDTRNLNELKKNFDKFQPQVVFHLAAQPIVRKSYDEPKLTFDSNVGGVVNVLECIKNSSSVEAGVIITSDKCYQNLEWEWGYRENDRLGGKDPYSASKACVEIACKSYITSFFNTPNSPKVSTTRAGNVIGGGDWAPDRIVPDCVKAWSKQKKPFIRNPGATRPWQHILEPLSGYLCLGEHLLNRPDNIAGEAFNFGPDSKVNQSVGQLADLFLKFWGQGSWKHPKLPQDKKESILLKLCCDRALHRLAWYAILDFQETVKLTAEWYKNYYNNSCDMYEFTCSQIDYYAKKAVSLNMPWAIKD